MKLSKEEWKEIRSASEAGIEDSQLSQTYQIPKPAIRMRRMREKWLTPNRIQAEIAANKARAEALARGNKGALVESDVTRVTKPALEAVSERLLEDGKAASLRGMVLLKNLLERAKPEDLADLADVGDVVQAVKGARLIAGLDKEGQSLTLNLGAFWEAPVEPGSGPVEKPMVLDVED